MTTDAKTYLSKSSTNYKSQRQSVDPAGRPGCFALYAGSAGRVSPAFFVLSLMILFIIMPVIYGQYIELITHNKLNSYFQVFRTHWVNYFVVSLILGTPILILSILGHVFGLPFWGLVKVLSIIIDILSIYIFPLVFLTQKHFKCIPLGIKCLFGNLNFSLPLVILAAIPSVFNLFSTQASDTAVLSLQMLALDYVLWVVSLLIDFIIFVAAALILKEKLLQS